MDILGGGGRSEDVGRERLGRKVFGLGERDAVSFESSSSSSSSSS